MFFTVFYFFIDVFHFFVFFMFVLHVPRCFHFIFKTKTKSGTKKKWKNMKTRKKKSLISNLWVPKNLITQTVKVETVRKAGSRCGKLAATDIGERWHIM